MDQKITPTIHSQPPHLKWSTLIFALMYGLVVIFALPLFFIHLNTQLQLPQFNFFPLDFFGIVCVVAGSAFWLSPIILFFFTGKGTPVPTQPPQKLVTTGIYHYTRNPMYASVTLILFGYFLLFGHLLLVLYVLLAANCFHLYVKYHEEPVLTNRFGKSYLDYCQHVPRWF